MEITPMQVIAASAWFCLKAGPDQPPETKLLRGERIAAESFFRDYGGLWYFGAVESYPVKGWVHESALTRLVKPMTHRVCVARTNALKHPVTSPKIVMQLSMNAQGSVTDEHLGFSLLEAVGWVPSTHLAEVGAYEKSPAVEARKFLNTQYHWGGCDANDGLDCSGLVQQVFRACGIDVPRNSSDQRTFGQELKPEQWGDVHVNDLVFWDGHVGIISDVSGFVTRLIHATGNSYLVVEEPLSEVIARSGEPIAYRRIPGIS